MQAILDTESLWLMIDPDGIVTPFCAHSPGMDPIAYGNISEFINELLDLDINNKVGLMLRESMPEIKEQLMDKYRVECDCKLMDDIIYHPILNEFICQCSYYYIMPKSMTKSAAKRC